MNKSGNKANNPTLTGKKARVKDGAPVVQRKDR